MAKEREGEPLSSIGLYFCELCVCVEGGGGGGQSVLTQYNNISKAVITITSGIYQVTEAVSLSIILLQSM